MINNIIRKISIFIKIIKIIKNWYELTNIVFRKKKEELQIVLRNNVKFYTNNHILDILAIIENFGFENQHDYFLHARKLVKPKIIDIGGHIGTFCIYAAKKFPDGIIFSYEPDKKNYEKLLKNIKLNSVENVTAFNFAVGKERGKSLLYSMKDGVFGTIGSTLINNGSDSVEVSCITLDDILKENNIQKCDLLKMDCEGSEYSIIFNTNKAVFDKIRSIAMEYHTISEFKIMDLVKYLEDNNYVVILNPNRNNSKFGFIYANKSMK